MAHLVRYLMKVIFILLASAAVLDIARFHPLLGIFSEVIIKLFLSVKVYSNVEEDLFPFC